MTSLTRVLGNGTVMLVSQVITWSASIVLTASLARNLGSEGFGKLFITISLVTMLGLFVEFGLDQQVVRAVARDGSVSSGYLATAAVIKTSAALVAYVALLVIVALLGYEQDLRATASVYGAILFVSGLSASLNAIYQGGQRMLHVAAGTVIEKGFDAAAVIVLFAVGANLVTIAAALVVGAALGLAWRIAFLRSVVDEPPRVRRNAMASLLRGAPPFLLYAVLGAIYYRIDAVLLSKLTDVTVVGWYGAAQRLFDTLVFLPTIVSAAVMLPILSALSVGPHVELRAALRRGLDAMLILGTPIAVALFVLAEPIVGMIYGPDFAQTAPALRWMAPGLLALYINSILMVTVVAVGLERRLVVLAALCCVLNLTLNIVLIPTFAHVAAAAVKSATEVFIFAFLLRSVPAALLSRGSISVFAKALAGGGAMAMVVALLATQPLAVRAAAGALTYGVAGLALQLVPPDDLRAVYRAATSIVDRRSHAPDTEAA